MGRGITRFFVHEITVETHDGAGTNGDVYAAPVTALVLAETTEKVTASAKGDVVTLEGTVYASVDLVATLARRSRITRGTATGRVLGVTVRTSGSNKLPDHLEVTIG